VAKYLVDRLYGPARGTSLASLEKAIEAVRLALAEPILKQALSRQARAYSSAPPDSVCCPGCQRHPRPRPPEPRVVRTDVGTAEGLEPHYFDNVQLPTRVRVCSTMMARSGRHKAVNIPNVGQNGTEACPQLGN
jgi:hypothetical protein